MDYQKKYFQSPYRWSKDIRLEERYQARGTCKCIINAYNNNNSFQWLKDSFLKWLEWENEAKSRMDLKLLKEKN